MEIKTKNAKEKQQYICSTCGREFATPILVEDLTSKDTKPYYACPFCLTKIEETKEVKKKKVKRKVKKLKKKIEEHVKEESLKTEGASVKEHKCPYHFGYLAERPSGQGIPEECLTCDKLVDCMLNKK
ncbi:hypothetical protein CW708_00130 [Candidatus Bathyarchaeota archaeon]|nr:MAG: hypothetical protein CW708_00130 [Candidatus Bathyarchaeota archaeon]